MGKGRSQETSADSGQVLKLLIHHYNFLCITYLNSDWGPAPTGRSGSHSRWREEPATGSGEPCSRRPKARGPCSRRPKAGGETSQSLRTNSRLPRPKAAGGRQAGRPEQMGNPRCGSARLRLCRTCLACCGNGGQTVDGNKRRGGGRVTREKEHTLICNGFLCLTTLRK